MKNIANIIEDYHFKILIVEDRFNDLEPVFKSFLKCENIYEFKKDKNGWEIFDKNENLINFDIIFNGVFLFDPRNIQSDDRDKNAVKIFEDFIRGCKKNRIFFDLLLIDLKLSEGHNISGKDILESFKKSYPDVPVFVFTWTLNIAEIIERISESEADYYVHKSEILNLNNIIKKYYEHNFGSTWFLIKKHNPEYAHILRKGILTWLRNPKLLWHGEKAMHLVDHTYKHSWAMYKILNKLIESYAKLYNSNDEILKKFAPNEDPDSGVENLFYLSMAIWLHDIGMKGYEKLFWCYEIRKKHPIISGYLIDKYPEVYLLGRYEKDKDENDKDNNKDIMKKNIALISTYHMFVAPLNSYSLKIDRIKERSKEDFRYPSKHDFLNQCYDNIQKKKNDYITLDLINENLLIPAALLRLIDVLDKGVHRVGILPEEGIKVNVCFEDAKGLKVELDVEVEKMAAQIGALRFSGETGKVFDVLTEFLKRLDYLLKSLIDKYCLLYSKIHQFKGGNNDWESCYLECYRLLNDAKLAKDNICKQLRKQLSDAATKRCISILEQIIFYLETPLHFITHRTLKEGVEFNKNGEEIDIIYTFNDDFINCNKNLSFAEFNRLFQESWKIFSDIAREYQPLEDILKNRFNFKKVKFVFPNSTGEPIFVFDLEKYGNYVEKEVRFYFRNKKEMEKFFTILKGNFEISEQNKTDITDEFYDFNDDELTKRGWSFRKRTIKTHNKTNSTIWSVKISPMYWKGEYEHRIEIEIKIKEDDTQNEKNEEITPLAVFQNILSKEPFNENNKSTPNFSLGNFVAKPKLYQKRNAYNLSYNGEHIPCTIGECRFKNQNKDCKTLIYFVELEAPKDKKPWEQEKIIDDLLEAIKMIYPEAENFQSSESKLELLNKTNA